MAEFYLLKEDGGFLLKEDGGRIVLYRTPEPSAEDLVLLPGALREPVALLGHTRGPVGLKGVKGEPVVK